MAPLKSHLLNATTLVPEAQMPNRVKRKPDALHKFNAPRCNYTLDMFPDTVIRGGTTGGGERENLEEEPLLVVAHKLAGRWGQYTEPEVFWQYWEHDDAVDAAQAWNEAMLSSIAQFDIESRSGLVEMRRL